MASSLYNALAWAGSKASTPFTATSRFLGRHQRKVLALTGTALVGGTVYGYLALKPTITSLLGKISEMKQMEVSMREAEALQTRLMLKQKLDQPQDAATRVLLSFSHSIRTELMTIFDLQKVRSKIQKGPNKSPEDLHNLKQIYVQGVARVVSTAYALSLLHVLLKLQLTIVARHVLVDAQNAKPVAPIDEEKHQETVANGEEGATEDGAVDTEATTTDSEQEPQEPGPTAPAPHQELFTPEVQEAVNKFFLATTEFALTEGLHQLAERVLTATSRVLNKYDLMTPVSLDMLQTSVTDIRSSLESVLFASSPEDTDLVTTRRGGRTISLSLSEEKAPERFECNKCDSHSPLGVSFLAFVFPPASQTSYAIDVEFTLPESVPERAREITLLRCQQRLHSMVNETRHLLHSASVEKILQESIGVLGAGLLADWATVFEGKTNAQGCLPFAKAATPLVKSLGVYLPEQGTSPWVTKLSELTSLHELLSLVYLPLDHVLSAQADAEKIVEQQQQLGMGLGGLGGGGDATGLPAELADMFQQLGQLGGGP